MLTPATDTPTVTDPGADPEKGSARGDPNGSKEPSMTRRRTFPIFAFMVAIPALAGAVDYNIDPAHSVASFKVRHLMVSNVTGAVGKVTGVVKYDPADP